MAHQTVSRQPRKLVHLQVMENPVKHNPIGVFDSGLGGLSVARAAVLPGSRGPGALCALLLSLGRRGSIRSWWLDTNGTLVSRWMMNTEVANVKTRRQ